MTVIALAAANCPRPARGQAGAEVWVQRYSAVGDSNDQATKVVTDLSGNVIVAGSTDDRITGADMLIIKYSNAGAALWTNRYNGPANGEDSLQSKQSLAIGPDGSVYVTGASYGNYAGGGPSDFATIKYASVLSLTAVLSDNVLVVSWPQWIPPWRLEMQTNSLNVGLSTHWMLVPGSTATNRMAFPVLDGVDAAFFRLIGGQ